MTLLSAANKAQNIEEQKNEKDVLLSIFDDAVKFNESSNIVISVEIKSKHFILVLRCMFHDHYPSHQPPIFTVIDVTNAARPKSPLNIAKLEKECEDSFVPGECIIYQWVVYLQEYLESLDVFIEEHQPSQPENDMVHVPSDTLCDDMDDLHIFEEPFSIEELQAKFEYNKSWNKEDFGEIEQPKIDIYTGEILTDRKSHFQAHVCKVSSKADIDLVLETLLQNAKIAAATHNILAYRYTNSSGKLEQDYDDDGEAKAGGRLLELLDLMKVENLLVIVSRWYGGVQLGPVRFKHINNIANDTIVASGLYSSAEGGSKRGKNKKGSKK